MYDKLFALTFSNAHTATRWDDRHELNFDELVELLTTPQVGPKEGRCFMPGTLRVPQRKLENVEQISVAILDSDAGHTLDEIQTAAPILDAPSIAHSTHSHMKATTEIAAVPYEKWAGENPGASVEAYLLEKGKYLPRVLREARIVGEVMRGSARLLIVEHQPCPKFRIVVPLADPWRTDYFITRGEANAHWAACARNLARVLGLQHDRACEDISRLFFLPRIATPASPFEFAVIK